LIGGIVLNSEFYNITSTGTTDFVAFDVEGAREVVLMIDPSTNVDGSITNEPYDGSPRLTMDSDMTQPLTVHTRDPRLYWVSASGSPASLMVWVIR
jgi:hypothetical protein